MTSPAPLVAIGHLTLDDVVIHDGRVQMGNLGGACLYAALGAQLVGAPAGILSRMGAGFPEEKLRTTSVDTSLLEVTDEPAIQQWVLYEADGTRQYVMHPTSGTLRDLTPRVGRVDVPTGAAVHLAPMHVEFQSVWCEHLSGHATLLTLDPHVESCEERPDEVLATLPKIDAFLPSQLEIAALGDPDPVSSVRAFLSAGAPIAVVKLGAEGAVVGTPDALWHVPGVPVTERDATGAGDTYCGAFAAALQRGCSAVDAARWAAAAASLTVEWRGTQFADAPRAREVVTERMHTVVPEVVSPNLSNLSKSI